MHDESVASPIQTLRVTGLGLTQIASPPDPPATPAAGRKHDEQRHGHRGYSWQH